MMAAFIYEYTRKRQAAPRFGRPTTNPDQISKHRRVIHQTAAHFDAVAGQRFQPQTTSGGV